jgi:hypothetical protein
LGVYGDDIRVTVNSSDEVMSFGYTYTEDVVFPSADVIGVSAAYNRLFADRSLELSYKGFVDKNGAARTYLVYNIESYYINALTGQICDFYGRPVPDAPADVEYTDIRGIAAEKAINEFKRHGVTLSTADGKFNPGGFITEREFTTLADRVCRSYEVYPLYGRQNNDQNGQSLPDKNLTRAAAARILVQALGLAPAAELKGIYKTPFADVSDARSDIGSIALAYALGAFKADGEGRFRPDSDMTRADAMQTLYDYVSS